MSDCRRVALSHGMCFLVEAEVVLTWSVCTFCVAIVDSDVSKLFAKCCVVGFALRRPLDDLGCYMQHLLGSRIRKRGMMLGNS